MQAQSSLVQNSYSLKYQTEKSIRQRFICKKDFGRMCDSIVWVKWSGNKSKRYDGKVNGMPRESLVNPDSAIEIGNAVDVWWGSGKARKIWHGTVVSEPAKPSGKMQKVAAPPATKVKVTKIAAKFCTPSQQDDGIPRKLCMQIS